MNKFKTSFIIGLLVGLMLSSIFFLIYAPRYSTIEKNGNLIKLDKWSGKSWRQENNQWINMMNIDQNWNDIDKALINALQVNTKAGLSQLRKSYPILKDIPDNELLERIKLVYSKIVLVNSYLQTILSKNKSKNEKVKTNKLINNE